MFCWPFDPLQTLWVGLEDFFTMLVTPNHGQQQGSTAPTAPPTWRESPIFCLKTGLSVDPASSNRCGAPGWGSFCFMLREVSGYNTFCRWVTWRYFLKANPAITSCPRMEVECYKVKCVCKVKCMFEWFPRQCQIDQVFVIFSQC